MDPHCWMDCDVRKTDRRLEGERSENWCNPTWRPIIISHPVRRLLSDSQPLFQQQFSYRPRCQEWETYRLGDLAIQRLGTWPLKSRVSLPVPREMNFSRREVNVVTVFLNNSKEHLFFSKCKHAFCQKNKKQKNYNQKCGQRSTFFFVICLFFFVS